MESILIVLIGCIISYLIGSVPSAVWVGQAFFGIDVRDHGSGNAGATNTFRVLGKKWGALVMVMDLFKGFIPQCAKAWMALCWLPKDFTKHLLRIDMMFVASRQTDRPFFSLMPSKSSLALKKVFEHAIHPLVIPQLLISKTFHI